MLKTEEGNYGEFEKILNNNKNEINFQNKKGNTALSIACRNGNLKIAKKLIFEGAKVNLQNHVLNIKILYIINI